MPNSKPKVSMHTNIKLNIIKAYCYNPQNFSFKIPSADDDDALKKFYIFFDLKKNYNS